jgi:hypothetical protein
MKYFKVVFIAILTLTCFQSIKSQTVEKYGIKTSITLSNFNITDKRAVNLTGQPVYLDYTEGGSINPSIGIFAQLFLTDFVNAEMELSYLQKGAWESREITVYYADNTTGKMLSANENGFQYLQFAFNVQPKLKFGETMTYITVGPTINYLVRITNFVVEKNKIDDVQIGYNVGIGMSLSDLINSPLFLELKYAGDFSEFYSSGNGNYWNQVFLFSLGIDL